MKGESNISRTLQHRESWLPLRRSLLAALMVTMILTSTRSARAEDPSLLLHYTFDRVKDDIAVDQGPHRFDGKIVGQTEFIEEVEGRHGVLRFDGETSRIWPCPSPR